MNAASRARAGSTIGEWNGGSHRQRHGSNPARRQRLSGPSPIAAADPTAPALRRRPARRRRSRSPAPSLTPHQPAPPRCVPVRHRRQSTMKRRVLSDMAQQHPDRTPQQQRHIRHSCARPSAPLHIQVSATRPTDRPQPHPARAGRSRCGSAGARRLPRFRLKRCAG